MVSFLGNAKANLLNFNLYPTMSASDRKRLAEQLSPRLDRSLPSISFSRGFGMTASQLGVMSVHEGHPYLERFETAWRWLTYFHNAIAAQTFLRVDPSVLAEVDDARRGWVSGWLRERGLPDVQTGTYYVKTFRPDGEVPERLAPLLRDGASGLRWPPSGLDRTRRTRA